MTKMHEILAKPGEKPLEPGERFTIKGLNGEYAVNSQGGLIKLEGCYTEADGFAYRRAINDGIIRKPRLTDKQIQLLYAGHLLGFRYLAKDDTGEMMMYVNKPHKSGSYWMYKLPMDKCAELDSNSPLSGLVQWDDAEPLDVLKILKDNNVEV